MSFDPDSNIGMETVEKQEDSDSEILKKLSHCNRSMSRDSHFQEISMEIVQKMEDLSDSDTELLNKHSLSLQVLDGNPVLDGNLVEEVTSQAEQKQFICHLCEKEFSLSSNLARHISRVHVGEKRHGCNLCDKSFFGLEGLRLHIRSHTGDKPYSCKFCDKTFARVTNLGIHIKTHTGDKQYKCDECGKEFAQSSNLTKHVSRMHTGDRPHCCTLCSKSFFQVTDLKLHMRSHTGDMPFSCTLCDKRFSRLCNLKIHIGTHSTNKKFKCEVCDKQFSQSSNLTKHVSRVHTLEKPHKCNLCSKSFFQSYELKMHTRIHTGDKPFSCDICDKSFSRLCNLATHTKGHGERPHICSICDKTFLNSIELENHMRNHTGEKPFSCEFCDKKFSQIVKLKIHIKTHTGNALSCEFCGKVFGLTHDLMRHTKTHTKEKPFGCQYCDRKFPDPVDLQRHIKIHIGETPGQSSSQDESMFSDRSSLSSLGLHPADVMGITQSHSDFEDRSSECGIGSGSNFGGEYCSSSEIGLLDVAGAKKILIDTDPELPNQSTWNAIPIVQSTSSADWRLTVDNLANSPEDPPGGKNDPPLETGYKPFKCSICDKGFSQIDSLNSHIEIHRGETIDRPHKCKHCDRSFVNIRDIEVHSRSHTGDKPFQCSYCGKQFSQVGNLNTHIKIHSGEKPYKCELCNKSFAHLSYLKLHTRTHTGEKPFKCKFCEKSFLQRCHLNTHIKKSHTADDLLSWEASEQKFVQSKSRANLELPNPGRKQTSDDLLSSSVHKAGDSTRVQSPSKQGGNPPSDRLVNMDCSVRKFSKPNSPLRPSMRRQESVSSLGCGTEFPSLVKTDCSINTASSEETFIGCLDGTDRAAISKKIKYQGNRGKGAYFTDVFRGTSRPVKVDDADKVESSDAKEDFDLENYVEVTLTEGSTVEENGGPLSDVDPLLN